MVLGARQLAGLEILALPTAELATWIREAQESNECLRLEEPERPRPELAPMRGPIRREASDAHAEWLANIAGSEVDWRAGLQEQLMFLDLGHERRAWVEFLIERLDDNGLLTETDTDLLNAAQFEGLDGGDTALGRAIAQLQCLEPAGVGGRDWREALLLQLEPDDPDYQQLCLLIEDHLDELSRNKLPLVAKALEVELEELDRLLLRLGELDPVPMRLELSEDAPIVRPDVLVLPDGETLRLEFVRGSIPDLSIDPRLATMAREEDTDKSLRRYLSKKINEARTVIEAVELRTTTLERVAREVFTRQQDYLRHGPGHLRPLQMTDIAERLDLHLSTISRAVAGKYVQTPWGVEPLRKFFQVAAGGSSAPDETSDNLRRRVRLIVDGEDPSDPLSDDAIAQRLSDDGLSVARRTVAKYRRELDIPSSYRRRKYA